MKPKTDKFKTNPIAKKIKQDNLARKMGTEESVKMIKDSLWRWNGKELKSYTDTKVFFIGITLGFALGILFVHFFLVMPILANYN